MILILSTEGDASTDHIVEWLNFFNYPFVRISVIDFIYNNIVIYPTEKIFKINNIAFDFDSVSVVWYRRFGYYTTTNHYNDIKDNLGETYAKQISRELKNIKESGAL